MADEIILNGSNSVYSPEYIPEGQIPKPHKKSMKPLIIPIIATVLLVAAVLIAYCFLLKKDTNPVMNTFYAVFDREAVFRRLSENGGEIDITASTGSDIYNVITRGTVDLNAKARISKDGYIDLCGTFGKGEALLDAGFTVGGDGVEIRSASLMDEECYFVEYEGFKEALDNSPFAPDGESEYAMPQELYDAITNLFEQKSDNTSEISNTFSAAFTNVINKTSEKAVKSSEKRDIEVYGSTVTATVYTYSGDKTTLEAFAEAMHDEWNNNDELFDAVKDYIAIYVENTGDETVTTEDILKKYRNFSITLPMSAMKTTINLFLILKPKRL